MLENTQIPWVILKDVLNIFNVFQIMFVVLVTVCEMSLWSRDEINRSNFTNTKMN